jgi:TRAP-type mannitol/chloroaromatic compound transport system permease large subunit
METGTITPPFGLVLFTMKGVSPPDTKMIHVWQASIPFIICNVIVIVILITFPDIITWLPNLVLK